MPGSCVLWANLQSLLQRPHSLFIPFQPAENHALIVPCVLIQRINGTRFIKRLYSILKTVEICQCNAPVIPGLNMPPVYLYCLIERVCRLLMVAPVEKKIVAFLKSASFGSFGSSPVTGGLSYFIWQSCPPALYRRRCPRYPGSKRSIRLPEPSSLE
jgi:hypothetical protein